MTVDDCVIFSADDARSLALKACLACGASSAIAHSLAEATVSAEIYGRPEVGFGHLCDYLHGFVDGRIVKDAEPAITNPLPTIIHSDAACGIAQLGFDRAYDQLADICRSFGMAVFSQKNSYTAGELGYYVRRLARDGLISLAAANGPALMASMPEGKPVFCTNPLAFGAPCTGPAPLVIDQASSATAFVNIVKAAETGEPLPEGWALDADGKATTDARMALAGALLPFGGYKGANIALMVEVLSAAVSGASWSTDGGDFRSGTESPRAGLTILVLSTSAIDPDFENRLAQHLHRLNADGVHIPGMRAAAGQVVLAKATVDRILKFSDQDSAD